MMVSAVMAVRDEIGWIERAVTSVLEQDAPGVDLEMLVVDGGSTDGTREVLQEMSARDPRLRVLDNPHGLTPHAFNTGVRESTADYVCILGSHASYDRDYVRVCLEELERTGATGCSGRVILEPAGDSLAAQLSAWTLGSPFASSGRSFRTARQGFADTIPYPVFRRQPLVELGGYNERLARNQDNDMNQRLRAAGHRLYLTWRTSCRYRAQPGPRELMRYACRNGYWNFLTVRENRRAMRLRHFMPLLFVACVLLLGLAALAAVALGDGTLAAVLALLAAAGVGLHLAAGLAEGIRTAWRARRPGPLLLPACILGFHASYGAGTLAALLGLRRREPRQGQGQAHREPQLAELGERLRDHRVTDHHDEQAAGEDRLRGHPGSPPP